MTADAGGTIIDMTPEGGFREAPRADWRVRATGVAALAALGGVVVLTLALAVWLTVTVLPILVLVVLGLLISGRLRRRRWKFRRWGLWQ